MSQKHIPHCCLVFLTEKKNYLTKIIKCDEELILKNFKSIELFKKKIEKGQLSEKDIFLYERSQNGDEVYVWECEPTEKDKFDKCVGREKPIDFFLEWVWEEFT